MDNSENQNIAKDTEEVKTEEKVSEEAKAEEKVSEEKKTEEKVSEEAKDTEEVKTEEKVSEETKTEEEKNKQPENLRKNGEIESLDSKNNPEKSEEKKQKAYSVGITVFVSVLIVGLIVVGILIVRKTFFGKDNIKLEPGLGGTGIVSDNGEGTEENGNPSNDGVKEGNVAADTKNGGVTMLASNGINDTGDFTLYATEYEGKKGTGDFNYGEALQKAILFYELQRSGDLPDKTRCNWRGDSALNDGEDNGVDLTGGLYDAGDHVKFNLPMAYTSTVLSWSIYENRDSYEESKQLEYALNNIRWIDDYLIKCHTAKEEFYYQVGNGGTDHGWWGPCEIMTMDRPSYKVDASSPGSTVTGGAAAALAAGSVIFKKEDPAYSKELLKHAKELYEFAAKYQSDAGYTEANGFYNSYSGFYDELSFAAAWLYLATGEKSYQDDAKKWFDTFDKNYKWTLSWDDASLGTALVMGRITGDRDYLDYLENNLDYWTTGVNGEKITYTPKGLAWLDSWGSLRYASTASFLALTYAKSEECPKGKQKIYHDFAVDQINYCLGSTGFSYLIGFGEDYPVHPHHRTSQGSPSNNMNDPAEARHILCGALVGGPDANDGYTDEVSNYTTNEVADDYNAGFVGALAALYGEYGGQTLKNYGAVENVPSDEISVEGCINVNGDNFLEVKACVYNRSAWPARALQDATLCYFVDLSEFYEAGGSVSDISVNMNYSQGGNATGLQVWDEANHIYYLPVSFAGTTIAPGNQDMSKKEVQFRMTSSGNWNNSNDYSYQDIDGTSENALVLCNHMALYEGDTLVFGSVPDGKVDISAGKGGNEDKNEKENNGKNEKDKNEKDNNGKNDKKTGATEASGSDLKLTVQNQSVSGSGSTLAFTVNLENTGKGDLNLSDLEINYFMSEPDTDKLVFYCDYAAVQGEHYETVTDRVKGRFEVTGADDKTANTRVRIFFNGKEKLPGGHTLTVQIRVARGDWSNMTFDDDYSAFGPEHMTVTKDGKEIIGEEPK